MIRYPNDIKAEMDAAAKQFCEVAGDSCNDKTLDEIGDLMMDYVYNHVSDRAKAFIDDVRAIREYAEKHGLMV